MEIKKVGVVGAGTMGSAIAEVLAFNGLSVTLKDIKMSYVEKGLDNIRRIVEGQVKFNKVRASKEISRIESLGIKLTDDQKSVIENKLKPEFTENDAETMMKNITITDTYDSFGELDYVVEAVFEDLAIKNQVFSEITKSSREDAILSSNTSSLSITKIAAKISNPQRVIVTHFFNPPYTLPLVEVVPAVQTGEETVERMLTFYSTLKNHRTSMVPIRVKEVPGFLVNRILVPMMNEAAFMLDEGVASAKDIDRAMKSGANLPMGPLELSDMVGLDVTLDVVEILTKEYGDPKYRSSQILKKLVDAGKLGRKSGEGFYTYH